ncbi:MAG: carboxypeptidase-like regulatory domain-containing protein, partial [Pseudomonadota bacterium]|nr:carboxypeptidase-like regulatory domain-containing protein [Pseudomonadota bacterium]
MDGWTGRNPTTLKEVVNGFAQAIAWSAWKARVGVVLLSLATGVAFAQTPPGPTANCTVTAMNRTAPLQSDFSFTIYDIPGAATAVGAQNIGNTTPAPPFRVRAVCSDGTIGETELAFPEFGGAVVYTGPLYWRPATPVPVALNLAAANPRVSGSGQTQLQATGVLANAQTIDLSTRAKGTLYTSSNPLLAQVSENGLVSVAALVASGSSASVVMTGQNDGVAGSAVIEIGPRGRIAGRITRADGVTPVPGVEVSILRNQPRETAGIVHSDAGGNYSLEDVGAGSFTLSVRDPSNGDMGRGSTAIANEGDTGNADIRLNGQATLTVNVVNGADAPVSGALVTFTSLSGFRDVRTLPTDSSGRAVFSNALAGQFTVSTRDPASNLVGAALGNLVAGVDASVTLKLQPIGQISGAVYGADGVTAQQGVQVRLVSAVRGIITQSVTAADGRFAFDSLPLSDSPYTLDAFQNGRLRTRVPGLILTSAGQQLTQNIVFGPSGAVTGTVLRSNGSPAQDATINLQSQVGQRFAFSTRTDAQGRYRIDGVPVGAFGITATGTAGEVASGGGNVAADGQVVTLDLQLAANGIVGTVFQRDGATPVGAGITVRLDPGNISALTNAQGQYAFSVSQPNRYEIEASDAAGNRGRTEVIITTVVAGAPITANVTFLGRGTVQGVVRDPSGIIQPGVSVTLTSSSVFGGSFTATTNALGAYTFANVFVGNFSVYARNASTGLAGVSQSRVAGEAESVTADVTLAATGSVNGQVRAQDGTTPIASAVVELFINGTRALNTAADASGNFNFPAVPLGDFR